jgi:predicted dehydrogenase
MNPLRVGVAGAGRIFELVHQPNLKSLPGVKLVALADSDALRLSRCQEAGVSLYQSWEELCLDPVVDVVVIALPTPIHARAALLAFQSGKHVYIEKPLAATLEEGEALIREWRKAGTQGGIGFNYRYSPLLLEARQAVRGGLLGKISGARMSFTTAPRPQPAWKTSILEDLGAHLADAARFVFEEEVLSSELIGGGFLMRMVSGLPVQCFVSGEAIDEHQLEIYGDRGKWVRNRLAKNWMGRVGPENSFYLAMQKFLECVRSGEPYSPGLEDGFASLKCFL